MDTETIASTVLNEEQLSLDLIEAQYALMNTRDQSNAKSLVILVSGIDLAGKTPRRIAPNHRLRPNQPRPQHR